MNADLLRTLAPQVLAALTRRYGHFDEAEEATQEALLAATTQWPRDGVPDNPQAWLIRVASSLAGGSPVRVAARRWPGNRLAARLERVGRRPASKALQGERLSGP